MDRTGLNAAPVQKALKGIKKYKYILLTALLGVLLLLLPQEGKTSLKSCGEEVDERTKKTETVVLGSGAGAEVVVTHSRYPRFVGALIVCEGGDRADVQLNVTQAVSALTGLSSDRITVVRGTP